MTSSLLFLLALLLHSAQSACIGCNDSDSCDAELVDDLVYACSGTWGKDYQQGVDNDANEAICADGYHICGNDEYNLDQWAVIWQLTIDQCVTANIPVNKFYISSLKSGDGINCDDE